MGQAEVNIDNRWAVDIAGDSDRVWLLRQAL